MTLPGVQPDRIERRSASAILCVLQTTQRMPFRIPMTMRLMTRKRLREYIDHPRNAAAKDPMPVWAATVERSAWSTFLDVKATFPSADLLVDERVCFDVGGNKWRIIANVAFKPQIVFIAWIGTLAEYEGL